jgi:hypothetical protein
VTELVWSAEISDPLVKYVLIALADHAHDDGSGAYPSIGRLCWRTGLSRTTVKRCLHAAAKARLILEDHPATQLHPTRYRFNLDELQGVARRPSDTPGGRVGTPGGRVATPNRHNQEEETSASPDQPRGRLIRANPEGDRVLTGGGK